VTTAALGSNIVTLTKDGTGTLTLGVANAYTGGTTVSGGGLVGTAQAAGSPFGASSGAMTLNLASLALNGIASTTTTTVGDLVIGAPSTVSTGGAILSVNNTGGAGVATTFAAGNLVRGGSGSILAIAPITGNLGTGEVVTFTGGTATPPPARRSSSTTRSRTRPWRSAAI
jgi:autotransporter-associated beta strand protein